MARTSARRVGSIATAVAVAATTSALVGAPPAQAAGTAAGPGPSPRTGGLPFRSTLTNGVVELGSNARSTGGTGRACGVIGASPSGQLVAKIRPSNSAFAPMQTQVGLLSFTTTVKATSVLQGPSGVDARGNTTAILAGRVGRRPTSWGRSARSRSP